MSQSDRERARAKALEQDVKLLVPITNRVAKRAKHLGGNRGRISTKNVKIAAAHLQLAYSDRAYLSAVWSRAMLEADLKPAGWERTPRIGRRGGSVVRLWRYAA